MSLTTTRATSDVATRLPMPALLALGAATLVMVTAEMLPTAVLVPMSAGLGVSESLTGQLVATWALTVVVASLPLTRLTRRVDRRALIVAGLVGLAASSLATGLAPSFGVALGARLIGAAAVGLLWATANAHVADLVPEALLGRAVAMVLMGATLGMVIGTPLARVLADVTSWRVAFGVLAGSAVAVAVVVWAVVPSRPRLVRGGASGDTAERASLAPTLIVTVLVGLLLVGFYGTYTFITRLGEPAAGLLPGGMGSLLLGFGLASAVGVALAGRVARPAAGLVVASAATALGLIGLLGASEAGLGLVAILGLGVAS
ncbi:MAG TPA: MFS transporter, partial [Intrasporangium sp.]|uniref:MFS transporter n=1 Tax=Intrasporangium sp. TaxID=1925024 RepID=UPI002F929ECB